MSVYNKKFNNIQREADAIERRRQQAIKNGNIKEQYVATQQFEQKIKEQEEVLNKMDPSSKEYETCKSQLNDQKGKLWDMKYENRIDQDSFKAKETFKDLEQKNDELYHKMSKAIEKGDVKGYESLKTEYDKNLNTQEAIYRDLKANNNKNVDFEKSIYEQKVAQKDLDIDMRNKISNDISEKEAKGKKVSAEERENQDKYIKQVKEDEKNLVKYNNDKQIEGLREKNASKEEIEMHEEENERDQKWVNEINR